MSSGKHWHAVQNTVCVAQRTQGHLPKKVPGSVKHMQAYISVRVNAINMFSVNIKTQNFCLSCEILSYRAVFLPSEPPVCFCTLFFGVNVHS